MSKRWFRVSGEVTVSAYTYIPASSPEEAMQLARGRDASIEQFASPLSEAIVEEADGELVPTGAEEVAEVEIDRLRRHYGDEDGSDDDSGPPGLDPELEWSRS